MKKISERIFARYEWFSTIGFYLGSIMSTYIVNISMGLTAYYTIIPYGLVFFSILLFLVDVKTEIS